MKKGEILLVEEEEILLQSQICQIVLLKHFRIEKNAHVQYTVPANSGNHIVSSITTGLDLTATYAVHVSGFFTDSQVHRVDMNIFVQPNNIEYIGYQLISDELSIINTTNNNINVILRNNISDVTYNIRFEFFPISLDSNQLSINYYPVLNKNIDFFF